MNGKESIEKTIETINNMGEGFRFARDYVMRLALLLSGANPNLKIQSLTKNIVTTIQNDWNNIQSALVETTKFLTKIGLSGETITSYNATMPIVYYAYKGGSFKHEGSEKSVRKFLTVSMAKGLFGVASNRALYDTREAIKSIDCNSTIFSLDIFNKVVLTGGRNFGVTEYDIDYWLDNYEKGANTFVLLSLLYPHLKFNQVSFHQDHCHPYVAFENKTIKELNLPEEKVKEWKKKRNLLPNLQLLEGSENESKNKKPLVDWIAEGNNVEYLPEDVSFDFKDFEQFFERRREILKTELKKIFEV